MSASFHFTHKITDSSFDYMDFVRKTMGYDTADVVGLGIVMWLSVIIYLLLSWLMGVFALLFKMNCKKSTPLPNDIFLAEVSSPILD